MADLKISQLPAAAALTGSELVELVQSGGNVKSTIGAVTATAPVPTLQTLSITTENYQVVRGDPRAGGVIASGPVGAPWASSSSQTLVSPNPNAANLGLAVGMAYTSSAATGNTGADFFANQNNCRAYRQALASPLLGGFQLYWEFLLVNTKSDQTFFIGWAPGTVSLGNTVVPSALINMVGFGKDQGDANLQFMVNNGAGTATKIDTGIAWSSFGTFANRHLLSVRLDCDAAGNTITATFTDLETGGATFTTTVPTAQPKNIPANTAVSPHLYAGEGTATTTGVSVGFKYAYFNYGLINE